MIDRKHLGARNEMFACTWLLDRGYEVFRNVSMHGLIDIVAIDADRRVHYFDVKGVNAACSPMSVDMLKPQQVALGVKRLNVGPDGQCEIVDEVRATQGDYTCDRCGEVFARKKGKQRFCGQKCRQDHHNEYLQVWNRKRMAAKVA